tara:strand:- start:94 stop:501 length:408 start_codon:yes stop_codon:yes gene_type:complete
MIIGLPILEITLMIKIGQQIGAFNTILIIFFTATVGIYYAKNEGINTIKSGMTSLYKNQIPIYEMLSGASIAIAAVLLILPGFISDVIGFMLLVPFTRKIIINFWLKNKYQTRVKKNEEILDADIVEDEKDKNEL